jgi:hypothetical protein
VIDANTEYVSVIRTRLGEHRLLLAGEVDCMEAHRPGDRGGVPPLGSRKYIELKTSVVITDDRRRTSFERYKLLKFWAQSFLLKVPKIVVGFRDDDGQLVSLQTLDTTRIPKLVRGKDRMWDATVCMNFLEMVLGRMARAATHAGDGVVVTLTYDGVGSILVHAIPGRPPVVPPPTPVDSQPTDAPTPSTQAYAVL